MTRHAWIDASAGVAGDMLLGALVDAGAGLSAVQEAVDAVVPGAVRLTARPVLRAGQSGTKVEVEVLTDDLPERHWSEIEEMLVGADLPAPVREGARRTFARLAEAEAAVHGIAAGQVHFHEVGALDSIADVVGVCAGLHLLGVETVSAGPVAVGSGRIRSAHGDIAVPVPAVVRLSAGWRVLAGGRGELATPTGMALVTALSERCEDLPALLLSAAGSGAGTKDVPDRANLTRVLLGELAEPTSSDRADPDAETLTVLEANVDDLDPRLWPGVLARLLADGARDAWLVPILMKKGRPAHTLTVLARPTDADRLQLLVFAETSTLGVRRSTWRRTALDRGWADVDLAVEGGEAVVAVKVGHRRGRVVSASPEFVEVERVAARTGDAARTVLGRAVAAASAAGLTGGAPVPDGLRDTAERPGEA
ncbi:nickel pincer cofactor biosynthesis protein LarC [uncultured Friedmanniella sp.]|uniref:nickel pincer cofactor biosynthesis protein LarC n=1 Tax=uncultured Friedmanniella sp. TaxID=335381 RepID=UPI0035CC89FB